MFRGYLRLVLFGLGLLVGVQVPGFIDDYGKRVAAHRAESEESLTGFRETAARFSRAISMPWSPTTGPAAMR